MKKIILILFFAPGLCFATLGQNRSSVQDDIRVLGAQPIVGAQSLSTHPEIRVDGVDFYGQTIKEFSGADGKVFAISWRGKAQPNLRPLLANFFAEFKSLEDATPKGRRFIRKPFVTSQITVIRGGHLEDIRGIAYLNGQLPAGITLGDLQ